VAYRGHRLGHTSFSNPGRILGRWRPEDENFLSVIRLNEGEERESEQPEGDLGSSPAPFDGQPAPA